jgi:hypothetical protein
VLSVDGSTQKLFYLKGRDILEIMKTLLMSQYTLGPEGGAPELMKVQCHSQFEIKLYWSRSQITVAQSIQV